MSQCDKFQPFYDLIHKIQQETLKDPPLADNPKYIELLSRDDIRKIHNDIMWNGAIDALQERYPSYFTDEESTENLRNAI
jgi:hypothetical protein